LDLRESIKNVLEHDLSIEHDRGLIYDDGTHIVVEFFNTDGPLVSHQYAPEDVDLAIEVFFTYIHEGENTEVLVDWIKEGF
jgi:hypothetical protein